MPKGIKTTLFCLAFAFCIEGALAAESPYQACRSKINFGQPSEAEKLFFAQKVVQSVHTDLRISKYHAYRNIACLKKNDFWFKYYEPAFNTGNHPFAENWQRRCDMNIQATRRRIAEQFPLMRHYLAMSQKAEAGDAAREFTPMLIRYDESNKKFINEVTGQEIIRAHLQPIPVELMHPYKGLSDIAELTPQEILQAIETLNKDYLRFYFQYLDPHAKEVGVPEGFGVREFWNEYRKMTPEGRADFDGKAYQFMEKKRAEYFAMYKRTVEQEPVIAFLSHANPTDTELLAAFEKIKSRPQELLNAMEVQFYPNGKTLDASAVSFDSVVQFAPYKASINRLLANGIDEDNSRFCGFADELHAEFKLREFYHVFWTLGGSVVLLVGCQVGGRYVPPLKKACMPLINVGLPIYMIVEAELNNAHALTRAFSATNAVSMVASLDDLDDVELERVLHWVTAPLFLGIKPSHVRELVANAPAKLRAVWEKLAPVTP